MKKDYLPVSNEDAGLSEIDRIERYWTQVWESQGGSGVAFHDEIEKRDEFRVMKPVMAGLDTHSRILDGGCGLGEWTRYYANNGFNITGLDISEMTVIKLKELFKDIDFQVGDICDTGFEPDSFDAYFSWGAFEHFEKGLGAPLNEAYRILKPGGYLMISVPLQNWRHIIRDQRSLWLWDENYDKNSGYQNTLKFYQWRLTRQELKREFERCGFSTVNIEEIHKSHGVSGLVRFDLPVDIDSKFGWGTQLLLQYLLPKKFISHMLLGIAQKI